MVLKQGPAKKVCIYVSEDRQYHGNAVYAAILDFLFYRGVSGATVIRGIAGFGADHHLHTARILRLTEDLPIKIEFIEEAEKVDALLPKLFEMAGTGLIDVQDTNIVKPTGPSKGQPQSQPDRPLKIEGKAKLMRIYIGEQDRWKDKPLHRALIESLRANDIAGVTIYKGIAGYGANRRLRKEKARGFSKDLPIMLAVVDSEEKIRAYLPILDDMIGAGLVVLSDVDIIKYTHDYKKTERRKGPRL
jgi:PII-like signaling protein